MQIFGYNIEFSRRSADITSRPTSPLDERWYQPFLFSQPTGSGAIVNPETALTHPTVYACIKVITETLATMPLILYKRTGEDKRARASDHPLFKLLKSQPNPLMTAMEFREMLTGHLLLRGNAYAQIIYSVDGGIHSLYPLHPGRMEVLPDMDENDQPTLVYKYRLANGESVLFNREQIFHLRGPSDNGLVGRSPLDCFREVVGQGMTMAQYLSNFYANNASPSGILTLPAGQTLSPKAKDRLRDDWKKKFSGAYRAGNVAVLEDGVTWQQVGMTSTDAQYADSDKMNALKICGVFRMPPHKVGIMDQAKYNNIEFQNIEFLTDTMLPHLERWEQTIERDLLRKERYDKYFAEHLVAGILRGDIMSRYKAYSVGRQWGWLSVNDIRRMESENPIDGGDVYLQPLNMIEASEALDYLMKEGSQNDEKQPGFKGEGDDPSDPTTETKSARAIGSLMGALQSIFKRLDQLQFEAKRAEIPAKTEEKTPEKPVFDRNFATSSVARLQKPADEWFCDSFSRILTKESQAAATSRKKDKMDVFVAEFYPQHREFVEKNLKSAVYSYCEQIRMVAASARGSTVTDSALDGVVKQVIDETIDLYYSKYKEAGDKVYEYSLALSKFLVRKVEDLCLWNLNKEENVTGTQE